MPSANYDADLLALRQLSDIQIARAATHLSDYDQDTAFAKAAAALAQLIEAKASAARLALLQGGEA